MSLESKFGCAIAVADVQTIDSIDSIKMRLNEGPMGRIKPS